MEPTYRTFLVRTMDRKLEFRVAPGQSVVLGRGEESDVVVADLRLSRRHCRWTNQEGTLFISNENAFFSTLINGAAFPRKESRPLAASDRVTIADYVFVIELDNSAPQKGSTEES